MLGNYSGRRAPGPELCCMPGGVGVSVCPNAPSPAAKSLAGRGHPYTHPVSKSDQRTVSVAIKLISLKPGVSQEYLQCSRLQGQICFSDSVFMGGLKFIFHNRAPNKTHKALSVLQLVASFNTFTS